MMASSTITELSREFSSLSTTSHGSSLSDQKSTQRSTDHSDGYSDDQFDDDDSEDETLSRGNTDKSLSQKTSDATNSLQENRTVDGSDIDKIGNFPNDDHNELERNEETNQLGVSRESTNYGTGQSNYDDYEDDFDERPISNTSSYLSTSKKKDNDSENYDDMELVKEDSVLIEKDGKFELIDPDDLKAEDRQLLGLSNTDEKPKKKTSTSKAKLSPKPSRPSRVSMTNPEYVHVQSAYAMSDQQLEMKKRRIQIKQMRKHEEKERLREEEEEQKKAAERSFQKWISSKEDTKKEHQKLKKEAEDKSQDEERRKTAQKAYDKWLQDKEASMKEEKRLERLKMADEAQAYVVRDRKVCDKAFKEWLHKKKTEREAKYASEQVMRKKSVRPSKRISTAVKSAYGEKTTSDKGRRPKSSVVRLSDTFGYRNPPSIDDFIGGKW